MPSKTSTKTIDLNCPGCDALLELDRGFAGGVCRCSTCGTLMTVPRVANEKAERLLRAERPGEAPPRRSERPERPERPESPRRERPGNTPPSSPPPSHSSSTDSSDEQTFRTASGREIRLDERRVPMANAKRQAIRAATVAVFVAVVGGALGLCGLAAYMLLTQPTAEEIAASNYVETFSYDESANPFAIEAPNLLGLPLTNRVALIFDPSNLSASTLGVLREALLDGLSRDANSVRVSLYILEAEDGFVLLADREPLGRADLDTMRDALSDTRNEPTGVSLLTAVQQALDFDPQTLITVTGRDLPGAEAAAIEEAIPAEGVRFDALMIGADSFALEDAARRTNGHYATLDPEFDLSSWQTSE